MFVTIDASNIVVLSQKKTNIMAGKRNVARGKPKTGKDVVAVVATPTEEDEDELADLPDLVDADGEVVNDELESKEDDENKTAKAVENLNPVFDNNCDKVHAAVNKTTWAFREFPDMKECSTFVKWTFQLTGTQMEPHWFLKGKQNLLSVVLIMSKQGMRHPTLL